MNLFSMDLHIHSALSPCGGNEMTPPNIMSKAKEAGIKALSITDHNSAENQEAFIECAKKEGISYLPGIEVQSREEAHILCFFDTLEQVLEWQEIVYKGLPEIENKKEIFGSQEIVNCEGQQIGENKRLLLTSTNISVDDIAYQVAKLGGLAIPAHIDRPAFSLWMNLGFIPEHLGFWAIELTPHLPRKKEQIEYVRNKNLGVILSSDAHWLNQIIKPHSWAYIDDFCIRELKLALKGEQGRYITYSEEGDPFKSILCK